MMKTLVIVARLLGERAVLALEVVAVTLVLIGVALTWGAGATFMVAGGVVALKSLEIDLKRGSGGG
jgi:hypothetical protein